MPINGRAIDLSIRLTLLKTQNAFWLAILVLKLFKVSSAYDLRQSSFIENNIDRSLFLEGKRAFHRCGADGKWHRPDKVNQICKISNCKLLKIKDKCFREIFRVPYKSLFLDFLLVFHSTNSVIQILDIFSKSFLWGNTIFSGKNSEFFTRFDSRS